MRAYLGCSCSWKIDPPSGVCHAHSSQLQHGTVHLEHWKISIQGLIWFNNMFHIYLWIIDSLLICESMETPEFCLANLQFPCKEDWDSKLALRGTETFMHATHFPWELPHRPLDQGLFGTAPKHRLTFQPIDRDVLQNHSIQTPTFIEFNINMISIVATQHAYQVSLTWNKILENWRNEEVVHSLPHKRRGLT